MKISIKEKRILSITLAVWGIFILISGIVMNGQDKTIINTKYSLDVEMKKIAEVQAKTNEIKLKDIEIEISNPLSVDIKDYLEDSNKISDSVLKQLKLDTSLVNINQAGAYKYTIIYNKKNYIGKITVKEKELPNVSFTLKTISLLTGQALSSNPRSFINEAIDNDVYNNLTLDISKVDTTQQGNYAYYITYKGVTHQGIVEVRSPGPTIITPKDKDKEKEEEKPVETETPEQTTADEQTTEE